MRIAVYCGAHMGSDPTYQAAAKDLGHWIVQHNYELVYGGSKLGLMGVIADSVLVRWWFSNRDHPRILACTRARAHRADALDHRE